MKRLVLVSSVAVLAMAVSSCAVGVRHRATFVTDSSATLNGTVLSTDGGPGSYHIEYGRTTARTSTTSVRTFQFEQNAINPVSEPVAGLDPNTLYHYAVCAEDESNAGDPYCSPDQTFTTATAGGRSGIAFVSFRNSDLGVWIMDADGGNQTKVTGPGTAGLLLFPPSWSPDGKQLVFSGTGTVELVILNADGTGRRNLTRNLDMREAYPAWSPDGSKVAFSARATEDEPDTDIWVINVDGTGTRQLTNNTTQDDKPTWSPDGKKIAFGSFTDSDPDSDRIVVMNADGSQQNTFTAGGPAVVSEPDWSPDGRYISFTSETFGDPFDPSDLGIPGHIEKAGVLPGYIAGPTTRVTNPIFHNNTDPPTTSRTSASSWAPDSASVAYMLNPPDGADEEIFRTPLNPIGGINLSNNPAPDSAPDWSPRPEPEPAPTAR